MILVVVAPHADDHAVPVRAELARRGVRTVVFDVAEVPRRARLSVSISPGEALKARVLRAEDPFDMDEVSAVWLRRISEPAPGPVGDAGFAAAEARHLLVGLAQALHDRRWVNRLGALALDGGWGKVRQLQAARAAGLEVPRTLATSDPEEARAFVGSCPGGAIYKPFASTIAFGRALYTTAVSERDDFAAVARAPCIFQERIAKRVDLRYTVMGDRVFCVEIHSQENEASRIDYRVNCYRHRREKHILPDAIAESLVKLNETLGLAFGTGDMIQRPDGGYAWLEVNQAGQMFEVAEAPGVDLLGAFCDFLEGAARCGVTRQDKAGPDAAGLGVARQDKACVRRHAV